MLRSLTSAVSGLKNFTIMLDVLGNNLANVRTLGYKGSRVTFSETRSQSLTGISRGFGGGFGNQKQIGLGVGISSTDLDLTQGSLEFTGTPTDMAIEGNSYFILSDGEKNRYARAGNFFFNNQGILVNPNGLAVQGWRADTAGQINVFSPLQEIFLDTNLSSPASSTETMFLSGNLDASQVPQENVWASGISLTVAADSSLALSSTDLNDLAQTGTPLTSGDTVAITGYMPDGTAVSDSFTYATDGTTVGALLTKISTVYGGQAVATLSGGKIKLTDVLDDDG
jgi:flagellar hook protein FlgE